LLVYFEEGQPTRFVVPDDFIVFDCTPGDRRVFKTWEEERSPDVVFEVTSRGTSSTDIVDKRIIYEQMGVSDYFLYDPNAKYLRPLLQGYRLANGILTEIPSVEGYLMSDRLDDRPRLSGQKLEMFDIESGELLLTEAEAEHQNAEKVSQQAEAERQARLVVEAQLQALQAELERIKRGETNESS